MTTFWFGVHFAEAVSVNLLPLTLYLFTENAFYIGLILAINPMFGFVAQPIVGGPLGPNVDPRRGVGPSTSSSPRRSWR